MIPFPDKKYTVIYADPPWQYNDKNINGERGACCKYPVMSVAEIAQLPVADIAAPDCLLAMWWTGPMMRESLMVIDAWGFTLKNATGFSWHKRTAKWESFFGLGHWTRGNVENCLFAVKGRPQRVDAGVRQFVDASIGEHSEKPAIVRERLVKLMGDVPRIELFARKRVPGWDAWGNEI